MTAATPAQSKRRDRNRVLITPEGISLPIIIASRGARAGALIMDLFIVSTLQVVTTLLLIAVAGGTVSQFTDLESASGALGALEFLVVFWIIVMFLFRNAYFLIFELGPRGATPGKRMAGIRIASRDGGRLSIEMVIARNLLRDIELFLPLVFIASASNGENTGAASIAAAGWFLIFALFPCWNRDRLRAGDIIAGSWVVEKPRRTLEGAMSANAASEESLSAQDTYQFTDHELDIYGEYELQTLERVLRENRAEAISSVYMTIAHKIGRTYTTEDEYAFLNAYYTQLRSRLETNMRMGQRKSDKYS